jgi:hypothetical protein
MTSVAALQAVSERRNMTESRKSCFVISPIGADGSPERKRADLVLKHIFRAVLEPLGYDVVRADEISIPGSITLQVVQRVLQSALVIADLTDQNPNVFYELAVRHASGNPVIHVIQTGQKIPFDIADLRTIHMDLDLDGAERTRAAVAAHVKEIEAGHLGENPVKLAGVIKHLESGNSEEKIVLKQILDGISEARSTDRQMVVEQNAAWMNRFELLRSEFQTLAVRLYELSAVVERTKKANDEPNQPGAIQLHINDKGSVVKGSVNVFLKDGEQQVAQETLSGWSWARVNLRPGQYQLVLEGIRPQTATLERLQRVVTVKPGHVTEIELPF